MSRRIFLHVGLPKSGTTYLQAVLGRHKGALQDEDWLLYPGGSWDDQVDAAREVLRMRTGSRRRTVAWDRVAAEMNAWPHDSVMSMEWLCMADRAQVRRIVGDCAPAQVHVVFTTRDLARTVPAAWQEFMQNRRTWPWPVFLDQVTADAPMRTPAGREFWGQQDMELLLRRWSSVVPADRIHVVTVPQRGSDPAELWRRLAFVLGIDPSGYELADLGANSSLGMESAELMRRVNVRLEKERLPVPAYNRIFKHRLAKRILASHRGQESAVHLPEAYHDWSRQRAEQQIRAIEASGARVVGDLGELRPAPWDPLDVQPSRTEPEPEAVLDAAVDAVVGLALERRRRRGSGGGGRVWRRSRPAVPRTDDRPRG